VWACTSTPPDTFTELFLIRHRDNFTVTFNIISDREIDIV